MNKQKFFKGCVVAVFFVAIFFVGVAYGKTHGRIEVPASGNVDMSLFWNAYNTLSQNYINKDKIDQQKLVYGAIAGMTQSVGDPYTAFFDPDQAKLFNSDLAGSFDGIGIEVGQKQGVMTVIAPLKGTPSDKAGIKSGDQIIKINGKSTTNMSSDAAVNVIRGQKGTPVTLTIFRDGWSDVKDFKIIRDTINIPSVDWQLKDGDVAYIHMYQFDQTLSPSFNVIAQQILKSPAKKIVLDLRGNPGGYLEVCQQIAGWFLKSGQLVTVEDFGKGKPQQQYKTSGSASFADYPIVVLIDKGSASAAEILSGALRDDRNVKLIGDQSFGKGSVQEVLTLQDGVSFLKVTIAKWLTPKGYSISEVGLAPDVKVPMPLDATHSTGSGQEKDPQLDKALEIVNGLK